MGNGFDITSFIPKFADENRDRLQRLNQAVLAFEKDASNPELLKEIMREVHTLKGTARMMGFGDIVTLSHKVEDVFVKIKEGGLQPTRESYDTIFHAMDILANMVETKLRDAKTPVNVDEICSRLESFLGAPPKEKKVTEPQPRAERIVEDLSPAISSSQTAQEGGGKEGVSETIPASADKKTIRMGVDKVDTLYNHLVELMTTQMIFHQRREDVRKINQYAKQLSAVMAGIDDGSFLRKPEGKASREMIAKHTDTEKYFLKKLSEYMDAYEADMVKLDAITEGFRNQIMSMRMQPISAAFSLAARLVRDLSRQFNKEANLVISGAEVELDNNIIEMLKDPMVHLLRNAVDHGMETPAARISMGKKREGTIRLSAQQEGSDVLITIEDDGKGIDREQIKATAVRKGLLSEAEAKKISKEEIYEFIMKPGFTTSKIITDTSGRGVGMDVVKSMVDRLNGALIVESNEGQGTKFVLKIPATISIINTLVIRVGSMTFAVPSSGIERIAQIVRRDIRTLEGRPSVSVEGQTIPLIYMADIFMLAKETEQNGGSIPVIVFRSEGKKVGFIVDEFLYEKEIVFKEFKGYLKRPRNFSGITTLGTGQVVPILNAQELVKAENLAGRPPSGEILTAGKPTTQKHAILVVEDSMITAELEKNILTNAGYDVNTAIDGIDAVDKLSVKKYDLLVTDIDMPRMNGFELTLKVRADKRWKDMPVIVVSARQKDEDRRKGIESGADAYILKKEFDQGNLLDTIQRLIGYV